MRFKVKLSAITAEGEVPVAQPKGTLANSTVIADLTGILEEVAAGELCLVINELVEAGLRTMVVNLSDLERLDRAGLGLLLACLRGLRDRVEFQFIQAQPPLQRTLIAPIRLPSKLRFYTTREEAVQTLRASL